MQVSPSRVALALAAHMRGCAVDDQLLLLDLRSGRYIGLAGTRAWALASVVAPSQSPDARANSLSLSDAEWSAITEPLIGQGLLTKSRRTDQLSPSAQEARATLVGADALATSNSAPPVTTREVWHFALAILATALWLRTRTLLAIVQAVERHRARGRLTVLSEPTEALRSAVAVFDHLRPLAFTARDRCLFDSLALNHFLACQGLAVQWLVGVRTRPFGAHAWLQCGATVLNDQHEHVRRYTPILVV